MYIGSRRYGRRIVAWLGLVCILISYVVLVVRLHPTTFFGYIHDDTLYFSSAKALAEGRGYILPSVPGAPVATKYPVLYPWLLSWVWRWNPSFPANLAQAVALSVFFGLAFITLIFVFLRRLGGFTDSAALLITAFCALHPALVFYGAVILPEIPFAVLGIGAVILADRSIQSGSGITSAVLCGILAGLSMQMRMIGIAIIAGIAVAALLRHLWRQFFIFAASASVFLIPATWRGFFAAPRVYQLSASAATGYGWSKTWAYYTDYPGFYRMCHPDVRAWAASLESSLAWLLRTPSDYFLLPSLTRFGLAWLVAVLVVTVMASAGIVRQGRRHGWKTIHYVLPFYIVVALLWNYNDDYRFFLPFVPLLAAGYWLETKRVLALAREAILARRPAAEAALACSLVAVIAAGNLAMLWNYSGGVEKMVLPVSRDRRARLPAKREAYDWISQFTPIDSRIVAYEDASLYLYTGREALRPVTFTTAEMLEPERMQVALDHITDVARTIHADYWLVSDNDFHLESWAAPQAIARERKDVERDLPVVFRSGDGTVRIYALGCLQHPEDATCKASNRKSGS